MVYATIKFHLNIASNSFYSDPPSDISQTYHVWTPDCYRHTREYTRQATVLFKLVYGPCLALLAALERRQVAERSA